MEQLTLNAWKDAILLTKVYMQNMFQHSPLSQNFCEQLLRSQATRLMVTVEGFSPLLHAKEPPFCQWDRRVVFVKESYKKKNISKTKLIRKYD